MQKIIQKNENFQGDDFGCSLGACRFKKNANCCQKKSKNDEWSTRKNGLKGKLGPKGELFLNHKNFPAEI